MRGKTGTPLICNGAEEPTGPAVLGMELEGGGVEPVFTPGGADGVMTKGESGSAPEVEPESGATLAESEDGQGSVRKLPLVSPRIPLCQRAMTSKRYEVAGSSPESVVRPTAEPC